MPVRVDRTLAVRHMLDCAAAQHLPLIRNTPRVRGASVCERLDLEALRRHAAAAP